MVRREDYRNLDIESCCVYVRNDQVTVRKCYIEFKVQFIHKTDGSLFCRYSACIGGGASSVWSVVGTDSRAHENSGTLTMKTDAL